MAANIVQMVSPAITWLVCSVVTLIFFGCKSSAAGAEREAIARPTVYNVEGLLKKVSAMGKTVLVNHDEIPGYMDAMTMEFAVKDPREVQILKEGDRISFRLMVTDTDGWIEGIRRIAPGSRKTEAGTRGVESATGNIRELKTGDAVPEFIFRSQRNEIVKLSDFRGRPIAITFIFTRCPYPTFCPLLNNNFKKVQDAILKGPRELRPRLLSITLDPKHDTPERLREYADRYKPDDEVWTFLTGDAEQIGRLANQFGLTTAGEGVSLTHSLRTVVVDASGRVQTILVGNEWEPDDLVEELKHGSPLR